MHLEYKTVEREQNMTLRAAEFFDPFAEEGANTFRPLDVLDDMFMRYKNDEIEHDYTADHFVADVWALYEDTAFVEDFAAMQQIQYRLAELCTHDHALAAAFDSYDSKLGDTQGEHTHGDKETHSAKTCKRCQKGLYCPKT